MKYSTEHVYPPIGTRDFDWSAVVDGREESGPTGWGRTELEALQDLLDQLEDEHDEPAKHASRP